MPNYLLLKGICLYSQNNVVLQVEHNTNRAVIIDLGLAKFFKYGLNSAMDMGNEAYSAPEVLQGHKQRDQRSDVWAMGKIIAELCARVRLYTPSVCPAKIKETMRDQPYCNAVCRMVEPNPALRASMVGVISDIRRAGGAGIVIHTAAQKELLKPPSSQIGATNRCPSPDKWTPSTNNRSPSPLKWERSPRPEIKPLNPHTPMQLSPPYKRTEENKKNQALVPTGRADLNNDFMKMALYKEAAKDLPCNLPQTGRVVVRRFEEKNGEMEAWQQKEVVTRDGKIVKYDDIKFDSK